MTDGQLKVEDDARNIIDNSIGGWLARRGASPNAITMLGLMICASACAVFPLWIRTPWVYWVAFAIFVFGCFLDGVDGSVAKMAGKTTIFGRILDSTSDRAVDTFVVAAIATATMHDWRAGAFVLASGGMNTPSYVRSRAEEFKLDGRAGLGSRLFRYIALGAWAIPGYWFGLQWAIYVVGAISWFTVAQRLLSTRKQLINRGTL
jgi:CDP-diacylglycerol--glycerol-3-phosphate 3-phosphatidyltransferase